MLDNQLTQAIQALVAEMSTLQQLSIIIPFAPGDHAWKNLLQDLNNVPDSSEIILVAATEEEKREAQIMLATLIPQKPSVIPAQARTQCLEQLTATPLDPRRRGDDEFSQSHLKTIAAVNIINSAMGRAKQMNAGAKIAKNPCLWFLHADSRLDARCLKAIDNFDFQKSQLGYFGLSFLDDGPRTMGINSFGVWFRSRFLGIPFGDQGFVISKSNFEKLGMYREDLGSGEDHALVWASRKNGVKLKYLNASIKTSARKYAQYGWGNATRQHLRETWRQARQFSKQTKIL